MEDIYNLTKEQISETLEKNLFPKYRANQIWRYLYKNEVCKFDEMKNISSDLIDFLKKFFYIGSVTEIQNIISKDKSTYKSLFSLKDGQKVESVLMNYPSDDHRKPRKTICISSQVGCALGCTFCATGQQGFTRHLTSGEIISQVLYYKQLDNKGFFDEVLDKPEKSYKGIKNIVFMGMGEPLANYENTIKAIRILNDNQGTNFGARNITVSTVGLVPQILKLADEKIQINLAVSIHAPDNITRSETVPINKRYPIEMLIDACKEYISKTNRKIFFEYVLLKNQNDTIDHANKLGLLLKNLLCHVNLIPVNPTNKSDYSRSNNEEIRSFQNKLTSHGVPSTVRMEKGIEVSAGCGQLAKSNTY
jgi:23S rRNA (adenine2503-C2)-methyltransferase